MKELCSKCHDTGHLMVSYADPENGPTDDPDDEIGQEYCECPKGRDEWLKDAEESDQATQAFYEALQSGDPEAQRQWVEIWA